VIYNKKISVKSEKPPPQPPKKFKNNKVVVFRFFGDWVGFFVPTLSPVGLMLIFTRNLTISFNSLDPQNLLSKSEVSAYFLNCISEGKNAITYDSLSIWILIVLAPIRTRHMVSQIRKFGTNAKFTRGILVFSLPAVHCPDNLAEKISAHQFPPYFPRGTV